MLPAVAVPWDAAFDEVVREGLPSLKPTEELLPHTDLVACGLDSVGMMQMIARLEDSHGVTFPPGTMPPPAFANAGVLWGMVQAQRAQQDARDAAVRPRRASWNGPWAGHGAGHGAIHT
ncbi:phosphopantetheine-binding protein [Streptomyces sp. NPDC048172]|uniref:acyl carrier protein n=1 Tax=Streptomyces sp. NPDC048172 TaxID=3365505 RepID=UPI003723BFA2